MKPKEIIIEDYEVIRQKEIYPLLLDVLKEGAPHLELHFVFKRTDLSENILNNIADMMKSLGEKYEFTLNVIVETSQWKHIKRLRSVLNHYGIDVWLHAAPHIQPLQVKKYRNKFLLERIILPCTDYEDFRRCYHSWKCVGAPIAAEELSLTTKERRRFFKEWAKDPKGVWFIPFQNILSALLTGDSSFDCEHNSCMGRYLYIDLWQKVYFCRRKRPESMMYHLPDRKNGMIYSGSYNETLTKCILLRDHCAANCDKFSLCRGGCPFDQNRQDSCAEYHALVPDISTFIEEEIPSYFSRLGNPCLRQLYLSMIAYGYEMQE